MKPPESFVPLTAAPAPPAPREFRVAVLNGHHHDPGNEKAGIVSQPGEFQSMEARRPAAPGHPAAEAKPGEPRVTVQRDGDRVTHLRIQCTCGMIMDLACVYDAPKAK